MANPIQFEVKKADPRVELQRRLNAAPIEHAEALLVAFDVLESAHEKGLLDLLHGAIGSKNAIMAKLAEYAKEPLSIQAMRNLLVLGKLLGSLDPEVLHNTAATLQSANNSEPPSLWQIFKQVRSKEGRKGLGIVTTALTSLGRSSKD